MIILIALFSGAFLSFAFAPFNVYSLAFISPAILLYILLKSSAKQAFWRVWSFGFGLCGAGSWWIFISLHAFGGASVLLSAATTCLINILYALIYFASLGYIFRKCFSRFSDTKQCLLIFPALWVVWEFLRNILAPWFLLGYTQLSTPLGGLAPLVGVYGVSLVVMIMSGALVLLSMRQSRIHKIISLVLIFGFVGLGWIFQNHVWTKLIGNPIKVSLIQGNISPITKWNPSNIRHNIDVYKNLTLAHLSSQLVVWPEGAFPLYPQQAKNFITQLNALAKKNHSNIIFGTPIVHNDTQKYYNGLLLIGDNHGEYLKKKLVPFGEYTPLPSLFGRFMHYFNLPMSGFSKGPANQSDLIIHGIRIAPFICWEILFSEDVIDYAEHSELLLTASDDGWFGHSIALAQQLQMSQMRSLETGREQLVSTSTGITAFVSPFGKIMKSAPIGKRLALTDDVQPMTGKTPLMIWHYYPVIGLVILMLLLAIF